MTGAVKTAEDRAFDAVLWNIYKRFPGKAA